MIEVIGIGIIVLGLLAMLLVLLLSRKCKNCSKIVWFGKNTCKESHILCDFSGYETTYWHKKCPKEKGGSLC